MVQGLTDAGDRRWQRDSAELALIQPDLRVINRGVPNARIVGSVQVPRQDGRVDAYRLDIVYRSLDPFVLPDTYDLHFNSPREADRHIEPTGRFCMWLPQTAPIDDFQRPGGLTRYLVRVQEFLLLQQMYDARRKHGILPHWAGEQWSHGQHGHRQWFRETTTGLSSDQLENLLRAAENPASPGYRCPCGSGRRLGNCHKRWIKCLRRAFVDPTVRDVAHAYLQEQRNATS